MRTQEEIDRDNETSRTLEFLCWQQNGYPNRPYEIGMFDDDPDDRDERSIGARN
jgi:hypothetical protein